MQKTASYSVFLIVAVSLPLFLGEYELGLLTRACAFALLAISVDLLWGYTGILSIGQSCFFGIGAYVIGMSYTHITNDVWFVPIAIVASILVAVTVAALLGWFIFYTNANLKFPFYVTVVTLALAVIFNQAVLSGGTITGASQGLSGFDIANISSAAWYYIGVGTLGLGFAVVRQIVRSDFGLVLHAVRDSEVRCRYLGYHTPFIKSTVFGIAACVATTSGILYAAFTTTVAPSLVSFVLSTDAVIWTAVGGRGTLFGPILGAGVLNLIGPGLQAEYPFVWQLFVGLLFVTVVVFLPRGVYPLLAQASAYFTRKIAGETPESGSGSTALAKGHDLPDEAAPPSPENGTTAGSGRSVLRIDGVSKYYGSLAAVKDVSLEARSGELVSIVGPNGAGKSTLIGCIADGGERSNGTVDIDGVPLGRASASVAVELGIGRKFQTANVFDNLSVGECLELAGWRGRAPRWFTRSTTQNVPAAAQRVVTMTGLDSQMTRTAGSLGHGSQQALELAMVLALRPKVVLLDEPTAGLTKAERDLIAQVLVEIVREEDVCMVLIEHDFEFVKSISNRMVVLHNGELIADGSVDEVANSEIVQTVYIG